MDTDESNDAYDELTAHLSGLLAAHWRDKTGHYWGSRNAISCEIFHACGDAQLHVGFACSLALAGNEIARFIESGKHLHHLQFARLLLIQLHEFTDGMTTISAKAGLPKLEKPPLLSRWANHWAKHRVAIVLQHHPIEILEDAESNDALLLLSASEISGILVCKGKKYRVIRSPDVGLLGKGSDGCSLAKPGSFIPFIVLVPRLQEFVDEVIGVYEKFVENCKSNPEIVRSYSIPKSEIWPH